MNSIQQYLLLELRGAYRDFNDPLFDRQNPEPSTDFEALDARIGLVFDGRTQRTAFLVWGGLGYFSDYLGPRGSGTLHQRPDLTVIQDALRREIAYLERNTGADSRKQRIRFWQFFLDRLDDPTWVAELPDVYGRDTETFD